MWESWKAPSVPIASVTFLPFSSWWNWGISSCCGGEVSLEATGTIFRASLEAGLWSSPALEADPWSPPALEAGLWSSPEDIRSAVELPACCSASCSLEMGTLIGICVTLVRRKSRMDHASHTWQAPESSRLTTGHVWQLQGLPCLQRLHREERGLQIYFKRSCSDHLSRKLTWYKEGTIKHFYVTNIKVASYGTHSLKQILLYSAAKRKLPKSNTVSKKGGKKTSFCTDSALGQTRQGVAIKRQDKGKHQAVVVQRSYLIQNWQRGIHIKHRSLAYRNSGQAWWYHFKANLRSWPSTISSAQLSSVMMLFWPLDKDEEFIWNWKEEK